MILIFAVAILVLLALIGTAYLTATRSDRSAARQNALAAQEDMLLEGVKNMAVGYIVGGLFDRTTGTFRPAGGPTTNFHDYTAATGMSSSGTTPRDSYLCERIPALMQGVATAYDPLHRYDAGDIVIDSNGKYQESAANNNLGNDPTISTASQRWFDVTAAPLNASATSPLWPAISAPLGPMGASFEDPSDGETWDLFRNPVIGSTSIGGIAYPTLDTHVAADADGDGIADSGLVKLPMKNLNGLTWYYGIRIIDNNSAVNVAIAYKPNNDYTNTGTTPPQVPGDFFPTNIDLGQLFYTGDAGTEMANWNIWRFGNVVPWSNVPVTDSGIARNAPEAPDFNFISPYEQLWSQLGQRVDNPGYDTTSAKFQAASCSDQINLARSFVIKGSSESNMESLLDSSLYASPGAPSYTAVPNYRTAPYAPSGGATWFNDNFNYSNNAAFSPTYAYHTARPLLVSRNPVMNTTPVRTALPTVVGDPNRMPTYTNDYSKTNVNMASTDTSTNPTDAQTSFDALWRAYWSVMYDDTTVNHVPANALTSIFQPAHRGLDTWTTYQQLILRSALAAVNNQNLLIPDNVAASGTGTVISHLIRLHDSAAATDVEAMVYGFQRQPFITEVLVDTGTIAAISVTTPYIAIELHNAYPVDIDISNWQLVAMNRSASPIPATAFKLIFTFTTGTKVPAHGYLVIESSPAPGGPPPTGGFAVTGTPVDAPKLITEGLRNEVFLMRPRNPEAATNGAPGSSAASEDPYSESDLYDMVPVDQYDFTGMTLAADQFSAIRYHYVRPNDSSDANSVWRFIAAGPYNAMAAAPAPRFTWTHQYSSVDVANPAIPMPQLGVVDNYAYAQSVDVGLPGSLPIIQWRNVGWPGPKALAGSGNTFPFGGFARNGDVLQVPFIGGYRIIFNNDLTQTLELNSPTIDASYAMTPNWTTPDANEQVGRFCPGLQPVGSADPYGWASDLFDYLTVQTPSNDYLPDVEQLRYANVSAAPTPQPIANTSNPIAINYTTTPSEDTAPINGLININTASWKILSTLPMVTTITGAIDTAKNTALAQAIFKDRIKNGPFQSIFDLNRVPGFNTLNCTFDPATDSTTAADSATSAGGDITPLNSDDGVIGDFEARYLAVNRISNLITTRSDSFTVYIILEGWKNAGSTDPTKFPRLITTRRAAYIIDRSGVTATRTAPQIVYVPNQ